MQIDPDVWAPNLQLTSLLEPSVGFLKSASLKSEQSRTGHADIWEAKAKVNKIGTREPCKEQVTKQEENVTKKE